MQDSLLCYLTYNSVKQRCFWKVA